MTQRQRWFSLVVVALAFLVRVWALDAKPPHFDEGVNGYLVHGMRQSGAYLYDPTNYHGPLHFYVLFVFEQLFGHSRWVLRMPTVLAGTGVVAVIFAFARFVPWNATALAAVMTAVSPALVFYSRYAIHEMWMPLFTLLMAYGLLGLHSGGRRHRDLWTLCVGLAGMVLTKETYLLHWLAALIAWPLAWLAGKRDQTRARKRSRGVNVDALFGSSDEPSEEVLEYKAVEPVAGGFTGRDVCVAIAVSCGVVVAFYAGFGLYWPGVAGLWETWLPMLQKGHATGEGTEDAHFKEVLYYVKLMWHYEWPVLGGIAAALLGGLRRSWQMGSVLFVSGVTLVLCSFYKWPEIVVLSQKTELLGPKWYLNGLGSIGAVLTAAGLAQCMAWPSTSFSVRFMGLFALGMLSAYSVVPYKTPWCSISVLPFFLLLTGLAMDKLARATGWLPVLMVAALLLMQPVTDTYRLNFHGPQDRTINPTDDTWRHTYIEDGRKAPFYSSRYAYVQTTYDIEKLLVPLKTLRARSEANRHLRGNVLIEMFPLVWELGGWPQVQYIDRENIEVWDADFLIVPDSRVAEIEAQLQGVYYKTSYLPRESYPEYCQLYLAIGPFAEFFPGRTPEFHPRVPVEEPETEEERP